MSFRRYASPRQSRSTELKRADEQSAAFGKFTDRWPSAGLGVLLLPTLLVTVPIGLIGRAIWDGLVRGWNWPERCDPHDEDQS